LLLGAVPCLVLAQVVQLPSTRSLSYSGSAWVPDGGSTALGGSNGASYGSRHSGWGPYSNSGSGSTMSSSALSASVQIIDLAALDEALLASPSSQTTAANAQAGNVAESPTAASDNGLPVTATQTPSDQADNEAAATAPYYATTSSSQYVSANPRNWQRVLAGGDNISLRNPALLESDIRYYMQKGKAAEDAGSLLAARVYYKMARDLMTPELMDRYERQVAQRKAAEEARLKSELEAVRRRF